MRAADVVELLDAVEAAGATVWLNGGWGVDALLGEQTREHADLDLVLEVGDEPAVVEALRRKGFGPAYRGDTSAWNYALGDASGREVDLHVFTASSSGAGWYGAPEARVNVFTPWALEGRGAVGGRDVRTVRAEVEIGFHSGYPVDADDWHDVARLAERFGQTVPPDYDGFRAGIATVAERVVVAPGAVRPDEVELLLRLLPDWFGIEDAWLSYVDDASTSPPWPPVTRPVTSSGWRCSPTTRRGRRRCTSWRCTRPGAGTGSDAGWSTRAPPSPAGTGTGCCRSRRSGRRTRTPGTPAPASSTSLPGSCRWRSSRTCGRGRRAC